LYKKGCLSEAAMKYFEAIIDLEDLEESGKGFDKTKIKKLEITCRLNYANSKS